MRFLSICCTVLVTMCIIMQHQSVEAKPFIFKFFSTQGPARDTSSSSSSSSVSTMSQFPNFLSTKLRLLTSLLQSGGGVSGGFNFGFKKLFPGTTLSTTTARAHTSSTYSAPDAEFEPESTTQASKTSTTSSSSTEKNGSDSSTSTEKSGYDYSSSTEKNGYDYSPSTEKNGYDYSTSKVTTDNSGYDYSTSKVTTDKSGYDYSTSRVTTDSGYDYSTSKVTTDNSGYDYSTGKVTTYKPDGYKYTTPRPGYNYPLPDSSMIENEISNEVIMINNQYLPSL